jgi:ABC-type antimicrobial peptide transport system permease subunit
VAQRTREIGIRSALGAQARDIVSLLLRQATSIVTIGVAIGLAAASASVRLISVFLYGVTPHDMLTLIAVPVFVALTATIACVIPARRAANVDPLSAIRIG